MSTEKIRNLANRAIRMCAEDGKLGSFEQHEKTIIDNMDFLYWMVCFAELDERERLAQSIEQMPFGDTATSFAVYVRNFK